MQVKVERTTTVHIALDEGETNAVQKAIQEAFNAPASSLTLEERGKLSDILGLLYSNLDATTGGI
ncbi:hypothetical protein ACFY1P_08300 [Streptomyces sp. NPDC001407]|uniref:hypothetical protein n=1 Tax=Streptomyces sp. NPDC001407 TaxID=3364573 RepID=UPI00368622B2